MAKLQGFLDIVTNQERLHKRLMNANHKINIQGLKRVHRCYAEEFYKLGIYIQNFSIDYLKETIEPNNGISAFVSQTNGDWLAELKENMRMFVSEANTDLKKLGMLNNDYRNEFGIEFKPAKEAICILSKLKCKFESRWWDDFEKTGWDPTYIKLWDRKLHNKYKEVEKEKRYDY